MIQRVFHITTSTVEPPHSATHPNLSPHPARPPETPLANEKLVLIRNVRGSDGTIFAVKNRTPAQAQTMDTREVLALPRRSWVSVYNYQGVVIPGNQLFP